jgi:hypothetical protein
LRKAGHDVEKEASSRRARVDAVGEALEVNVALGQLANEMHEIFDAPSETVELPNDQDVPGAHELQRAGQAGSFCANRADLVLEDFRATSLLESFSLKIQVLILGRDAGIAD